MYFYSPSTNNFYPADLRHLYESTGTWPADALPVEDGVYNEFSQSPPQGKVRGSDAQGIPAWVDAYTPPMTALRVKDAITQKRWEVETGGITLPTGVLVGTGIDDQNRITSVVANAERAGVAEVDFKAANGWARITLQDLQGIATAVALHVQACFSAERAHHEAIDALVAQHEGDAQALQEALEAYDIEQGWPATDLHTPQPA